METVKSKSTMSEEDIKRLFITPALEAQWERGNITMEEQIRAPITDGEIVIKGTSAERKAPKKADYMLFMNRDQPIAIVEAKDNRHSVSSGLQQAKDYAQMTHVPFAYSSNGDTFMEHDFLTGTENQIALESFPSPAELWMRYRNGANNGKGLTEKEIASYNQPFFSSQNTYPLRYYQRNAVNNVFEAIAKGRRRILLVMATGTGKTLTAFQIVWRLLQMGAVKKVLYLADRNVLVDQSIEQDFSPLEKVIHKVDFSKDDASTITSYQVYFSLYQQLDGSEDDTEHYRELFAPDFFDLIIVDECHRGSAKENGRWRKILDYFTQAIHLGMTATPKETDDVSNIYYFNEPVYTYSLKQGIEDGFLAPFKVFKVRLNISDGWRPYKDQKDLDGNLIPDRMYTNSDFDYNIILKDRTREVADAITRYLMATDRMQKTIVFCPTEEAAERMRIELNNLNRDMVQKNPDYVVRITGTDDYGKGKLRYFISATAKYPVIATTSALLSTGADCKTTKLIVLDKMIGSMTEFKQIIGRGTRVREKDGKMYFMIMDLRNVTRLFADPDWDGPVTEDPDFDPSKPATPGDPLPPQPPVQKPVIDENGCRVVVTETTVAVYDPSGKLLRNEGLTDYTKKNILGEYATLDDFINEWSGEERKEAITQQFLMKGIDLAVLKESMNMQNVDDYDFICHLAYDAKPLTRKERAENVKKSDFLSKYGSAAREVLEALLDKYMNSSIYEIENPNILKLQPFDRYGSPATIARLFGGPEYYYAAIKELEHEIYSAA